MKMLNKSLWIQSLVAAAIISSVLPCHAQEATLQLTYNLLYDDIATSEPVVLRVALENRTAKPLRIDLGEDRIEALYVTVKGPTGIKDLSKPPSTGIARFGQLTLMPGEPHVQQIILSKWGTFSVPGNYSIMLHVRGNLGLDSQGMLSVQDHAVTLKIEPSVDLSSLRNHCQAALTQLDESRDYEQALQAAEYLGSVRSSVAAPFISAGLSSTYKVGGILVSGLERIGDLGAVSTLVQVMNTQNTENAQLARSALLRLQKVTSDPDIANTITRELQKPSQ